jgi:arabinofuranosyltransferase
MKIKQPLQIFTLLVFYLTLLSLICSHICYNWSYALDDSYITYRYAQNLRLGFGLVFNEGERYFGSTAMGMAIVLAVFSWITENIYEISGILSSKPGSHIPFVAPLITTLSVGVIANIAYWVALRHLNVFLATFISILFAILLFSAEYMNAASGHETYLFLAFLILAGYLLFYKDRAFWSGALLGIATTFRPDTLLYMVILVCWLSCLLMYSGFSLQQRQLLIKFLVGYFLIAIPWLIFCEIYFGQMLPGTLTAKRAQPLLGDFKYFTTRVALSEVVSRMRPAMALAIAMLLTGALLVRVMKEGKRAIWWSLLSNPLSAFAGCLLIFGFGQIFFIA